ncbi:MAG: hypothetical protein K2H53_03510 [Clostridia bacterium]|nr:hypothetical protein [Clostridia bacterium]
MKKKNGKYKIIWTSNVIFPGLSDTDKLKIKTEETKRGSIYDRNGKLLAGEGKVSSVGFVPGKMNKDNTADIETVSKLLGISADSINNSLKQDYVKPNTFVKLANISQTDSKTENELMRIAGIQIKTSARQNIPLWRRCKPLSRICKRNIRRRIKAKCRKRI